MIGIKNSLPQIIPLETGDTIQLEQIVTNCKSPSILANPRFFLLSRLRRLPTPLSFHISKAISRKIVFSMDYHFSRRESASKTFRKLTISEKGSFKN